MCKNEQTVHYCTILSDGQWDFLLEGRFSAQRQKCLHRLMAGAVRTKTAYRIKGIEIVLEVGQVAASDVELAEYLGCNRKTIGKLIDSLNRLGMLTTRTNNRTSIHTLHFLTGWYVGGVLVTNPHYVRPSATVKERTDGTRTPYANDILPKDGQGNVPDDCHSQGQETDSTGSGAAALSFPLCSSSISYQSANGQEAELSETVRAGYPRIIDRGERTPDGNGKESPKEGQDGTIGSADDTEVGTGD